MTKESNEDFENSTKCWTCDNDYIDSNVKVRDYAHMTGKYRGSAHRDYNINVKLCYKILVILYKPKKYLSHLIMRDLSKFSLKWVGKVGMDFIPNGLEKLMSFSINNKIKFY